MASGVPLGVLEVQPCGHSQSGGQLLKDFKGVYLGSLGHGGIYTPIVRYQRPGLLSERISKYRAFQLRTDPKHHLGQGQMGLSPKLAGPVEPAGVPVVAPWSQEPSVPGFLESALPGNVLGLTSLKLTQHVLS